MHATPLGFFPLLVLLLACATGAQAQDSNLLAGAGDYDLYHAADGDFTLSRPSADGLRVVVAQPSDPFYLMGLSRPIPAALPAGTRLVLRFRARSASRHPLRAVVELKGAPWTSVAEVSPLLTPEWRDYRAAGTTRQDYPTNGLALRFQFGHQTGDVELAAVTLENAGPDAGWLAARAALDPAAMAARIERCRKGTLTIRTTGPDGLPRPGVSVHIAQTRHAFLFGANIFLLQPGSQDPLQRAYQDRFTALLNYATLPFYWGAFEASRGKPDYAKLDAMSRWCAGRGLTMKGHPLVWHEVWPAWAPQTPDESIPLLRGRVTDIITRYRSMIHYWDVLNEANNAASFAKQTGEGAWIGRDGADAVVATALGWARDAARGASNATTLLYNDFNTGSANVALLKSLQEKGALPDAIGIQSHMHGGTWPLEEVWSTAERFSPFDRPIHFTEVTVLSGHPETNTPVAGATWPSTPEDEARQADYVASFYTLLFSHPAVQAITWWDFSDRDSWKGAPSGFVRRDMSPKPVYDRLMALIHGAWWTDLQDRTGADGQLTARVFGGEYDVTVTGPGGLRETRHITVPPGGSATLEIRSGLTAR